MNDVTNEAEAADAVVDWRPAVAKAVREFAGADEALRERVCRGLGVKLGAAAEAEARAGLLPQQMAKPPTMALIRRAVWDAEPEPKAASVLAQAKQMWPAQKAIYEEGRRQAAVVQLPARQLPARMPQAVPKAPGEGVQVNDTARHYDVAERFLLDQHADRNAEGIIATLRWWRGEWRVWTGTHYAAMEEDALKAELYAWLSRINGGRFNPTSRYVSGMVDALKARAHLLAEVEEGSWLGEGEAALGRGRDCYGLREWSASAERWADVAT